MRCDLADNPAERRLATDQIVLMAAIAVALAVGVVLVDHQFGAWVQHRAGVDHRGPHDLVGGPVPLHGLSRRRHLRCRDFGVGVVDVVAGAIREHGVDQRAFDLRSERVVNREPAGVVGRVLTFKVPSDLASGRRHVCIDQ